MKPMLAEDADLAKLRFPVILQPKIDGVRGINLSGKLTGRSLKPLANLHTTALFSRDDCTGLDGELVAQSITHPDLCRITSSAVGTIDGSPFIQWWIFDYIGSGLAMSPYEDRYHYLSQTIESSWKVNPFYAKHLRLVPSITCNTMEEVLEAEQNYLNLGFEGIILRDPKGLYKFGRSTVKQGQLLRVKRFMDTEAVCIGITEGEENCNEPTVNELGRKVRSSHQLNKFGNGMVGSMQCRMLTDVVYNGSPVLHKDQIVDVSPGKMPHTDRLHYFKNQNLLLNKIIKFKFFPHGIKDKPRFPTFESIRLQEDL